MWIDRLCHIFRYPLDRVDCYLERRREIKAVRAEAKWAATLRGSAALRYRLEKNINDQKSRALSLSQKYRDFSDSSDAVWHAMHLAFIAHSNIEETADLAQYRTVLRKILDELIEQQQRDPDDPDGFGVGSLHALRKLVDEPLPEELG